MVAALACTGGWSNERSPGFIKNGGFGFGMNDATIFTKPSFLSVLL